LTVPVQRTVIGSRRVVDQGDLLRDVELVEFAVEAKGVVEVSKIVFPLAVVLTQTCDVHEDHAVRWGRGADGTPRKVMLSYLVAPLYSAAQLIEGTHLVDLGIELKKLDSKTEQQNMRNNAHPRYHHLQFGEDIPLADSFVDFKHYFTASPAHLRDRKRNGFVCRLAVPHREALSNRFAAWTSRVGLPE
jgi:hypothetical protein